MVKLRSHGAERTPRHAQERQGRRLPANGGAVLDKRREERAGGFGESQPSPPGELDVLKTTVASLDQEGALQ